jgi:hypothetical protein
MTWVNVQCGCLKEGFYNGKRFVRQLRPQVRRSNSTIAGVEKMKNFGSNVRNEMFSPFRWLARMTYVLDRGEYCGKSWWFRSICKIIHRFCTYGGLSGFLIVKRHLLDEIWRLR